ncbi:menaquinone biosynthesis decarboxylase [Fusibacter bizertensis]
MPYKDLQSYLDALKNKKLLTEINIEVDPQLEITEIADRVSKQFGNALVFNNVKGSKFPLVINAMGTYERLNLGLGVNNLDEIAHQIASYMDVGSYASLMGKIKAIPKLAPLPFIFPRKVKKAPCQEVISEPNLDDLPIIKCWPQDGGRYITLPLVFTKDPDNGQQNVGMYRLQVYDSKTTGMHWHLHKDGKEIYEKYRRLGKKMPVSVALGCDPTIIYAATAPLPKMVDEMIFAGYLKKRPVKLVKSITNDIYVPAEAEFILEGYVELDERRLEGPFGDHTGYYSLADMYPVFHLEKITHRKNAIYPTTIVGKPPMEDCYLGKATERIFLPLMKIQTPEIIDMDMPLEGVFHNCAIVSIKKSFPRHANKVLFALWGLGQMMYTKMIIIVDSEVDVHDYVAVAKAISSNVIDTSHLVITEGPLDALDHASNRAFQGFRLGIDATLKREVEINASYTAPEVHNSPLDALLVINFDKAVNPNGVKTHLETLANDVSIPQRFVIAVDDWVDVTHLSTVSWKVFNNIDPMRDLVIAKRPDGRLFVSIDATKKGPSDGLMRPWPEDIEMTEDIIQLVTERWLQYGIDE